MQQAIRILTFGLIFLIPITSLLMLISALFPKITDRARIVIEKSQGRTFLIGIVNLFFLAALVFFSQLIFQETGFPRMPIIFLPVIVIIAASLLGILVGLTSITHLIGERILPEHSQPQRNIRAAIVLILALLTPFVGWYLFFPYTAILGFGGLVTALFQNWRQRKDSKESKKEEQ